MARMVDLVEGEAKTTRNKNCSAIIKMNLLVVVVLLVLLPLLALYVNFRGSRTLHRLYMGLLIMLLIWAVFDLVRAVRSLQRIDAELDALGAEQDALVAEQDALVAEQDALDAK